MKAARTMSLWNHAVLNWTPERTRSCVDENNLYISSANAKRIPQLYTRFAEVIWRYLKMIFMSSQSQKKLNSAAKICHGANRSRPVQTCKNELLTNQHMWNVRYVLPPSNGSSPAELCTACPSITCSNLVGQVHLPKALGASLHSGSSMRKCSHPTPVPHPMPALLSELLGLLGQGTNRCPNWDHVLIN